MPSNLQASSVSRPIILTGDRPTGPLHLGHYVGTLANRVNFQRTHQQFVLIADAQGLTDNASNPTKIRDNILEVTLDYLAVGIDPQQTTVCLQSAMPALSELTLLFLNYVTVARLERNPTIKDEIQARGFGRDIPAGFLCYPVAQAADITAFKATVVPVGDDQVPIIEQTNEIVRRVNRQAGRIVLPEAKAVVPTVGRLPGVDGQSKMSKSQGNAILLSASPEQIRQAVRQMYTDPDHIRVSDPGRVEGNVVFIRTLCTKTDWTCPRRHEQSARLSWSGLLGRADCAFFCAPFPDAATPHRVWPCASFSRSQWCAQLSRT